MNEYYITYALSQLADSVFFSLWPCPLISCHSFSFLYSMYLMPRRFFSLSFHFQPLSFCFLLSLSAVFPPRLFSYFTSFPRSISLLFHSPFFSLCFFNITVSTRFLFSSPKHVKKNGSGAKGIQPTTVLPMFTTRGSLPLWQNPPFLRVLFI